MWMLINKGRVFQDMLLHSGVRNIVDHALGNDYLLSSHSANIAKPGGVPMRLHTDQWWMPMPTHADRTHLPAGSITREQTDEPDTASIWPRVVINVVWMIGDFTAENGGTRIVPGSHLWGRRPDNPDDNAIETVALEGPAGHSWIPRRTHLARHGSQYKRPTALGHTHHILRPPIPSTGKFYRRHGTRSPRRGIARSPVSTRLQSVECLRTCPKAQP